MTEVKNATMTPFGRVYATQDIFAEALYKSEPALKECPAAAAKFVQIRAGVPSLTTTLGLSRATVMANDDLSPRAASIRDRYLEALYEIRAIKEFGEIGESLESAMTVGTHVHKIAELAAGKGANYLSEATETVLGGANLPSTDLRAAMGYTTALRGYLESHGTDYTPEVRIMREEEGWAGTADAVMEDSVVDWKTGKKLSLKQNLIQVIALADALGKTSARIVHLRQDGEFLTVDVDYTMSVWNLALRLFDIAVDEAHRKIAGYSAPEGWRIYGTNEPWRESYAFNNDLIRELVKSGGYFVIDEKESARQAYLRATAGIDVSPGGWGMRISQPRPAVKPLEIPGRQAPADVSKFVVPEAPF